jgi:hypothetical protein
MALAVGVPGVNLPFVALVTAGMVAAAALGAYVPAARIVSRAECRAAAGVWRRLPSLSHGERTSSTVEGTFASLPDELRMSCASQTADFEIARFAPCAWALAPAAGRLTGARAPSGRAFTEWFYVWPQARASFS